MVLLNAVSYIKQVRCGTNKASALNLDCKVTVFEVLIWFHFIKTVTNAIAAKTISLKRNYRTGNIVDLVVQSVCLKWSLLLRKVGGEPLSAQFIPYLWHKATTGCDEQLCREDAFAPLHQGKSLTPSVCCIRSGAGVHVTAAGRNVETVHCGIWQFYFFSG